MRHFHRLAACAATAVIALGTLAGTPASANEAFATRADPAVSYKFGPFVRRGVEMTENGVLTAASKLKRSVVDEKYADTIKDLFKGPL